ncbi:MAG: hypothetical protein KC462_08140 [Cyanobacteria bacterium HKST-UBA05]|nr:hypothetical protein [Cyanobacteria bacterium HKST-UBA05]
MSLIHCQRQALLISEHNLIRNDQELAAGVDIARWSVWRCTNPDCQRKLLNAYESFGPFGEPLHRPRLLTDKRLPEYQARIDKEVKPKGADWVWGSRHVPPYDKHKVPVIR